MSEVQKLERNLIKAVRQLRIADSLLFLNKVLAVSRGEAEDRETRVLLARQPNGAPDFVIHLIVRHLLQHGRGNTAFAINARVQSRSVGDDYAYDLTPLLRHPVIQVAADRFIAVDPWLIVERTSWGVFYDIFEKYQKAKNLPAFTEPFGYAFERLVDNLLQSVLPTESMWRETESPGAERVKNTKGKTHQIGDLAYRSRTSPVLIEVTSSRPTRDFRTLALQENLQETATRIAKEILQTFDHIRAIQTGAWTDEGLMPGQWVGLVVTFGRFETITGPFFRKLIDAELGADASKPYLVLSLVELDYVVKLVEGGRDFGAIIAESAAKPSFDPVGEGYEADLRRDAVSSFAKARATRMYDFLPSAHE